MSIKFLDLFCGAGGMSEGFERAGYTPVAHIDIDEAANLVAEKYNEVANGR
jgi:DNA (cytosine-5)-methyltransferase 1